MAGQDRDSNTGLDLLVELANDPYKFGFYEVLRLFECLHKNNPRFGYSALPKNDSVRLGQTPSLLFAPSTLDSFTRDGNQLAKLKVLFFGVFGPNGPLPLHLTEYARNRIRNAKDTTLSDFADMFHHRLLCLFYRAWADKEPTVQLDRPENDKFLLFVGSLLGLGEASLRQRDAICDHIKLHFAAHFGCHTHHAEGLISILNHYFKVTVKIHEFIGEWLDIPEDSYCYLNSIETTGQLGISSVIGVKSWQCQHKFRIIMGPLTLKDYENLLPTGNKLKNLLDLVNNYVGFEFNWDVNLLLKKEEVPATQLGQYGQLGWTSWLQTGIREIDANDLYLRRGMLV